MLSARALPTPPPPLQAWIEREHARYKPVALGTGKGGGIGTRQENYRRSATATVLRLDRQAQAHLQHRAREINYNTRMEHASEGAAFAAEQDDGEVEGEAGGEDDDCALLTRALEEDGEEDALEQMAQHDDTDDDDNE